MTKGILAEMTMAASAQMTGVLAGTERLPFSAQSWTADEEQLEAVKQQILRKLEVRMAEWYSARRKAAPRR